MGLGEKISALNLEKESYPSFSDFSVIPLLLFFFPAVRFLLNISIFEKTARRFVLKDSKDGKRRKLEKFKESAWKFVYFLSSEALILSITYDEPWFTDTRSFWVGPGEQAWPDQMIKLKLKAVYMCAAGFYTYSIFALIFWETRRSDFGVSMSHHLATVALIFLSYIFSFARVGSMVLALHDATDIFLEMAKMSKYCSFDLSAGILFFLFAVSWILLRLIYFPFWIIRSTSYEVTLTLNTNQHRVDGSIHYYIFNSLLFSLLILHIYWWVLIFCMLMRQIRIRGMIGNDVRSDSEGEEDKD